MMKAFLKNFTGSRTQKQTAGGPDEMCDAEVFCIFDYLGLEFPCKARIKQAVGSGYKSKVIEVHKVEGLPAGARYDHDTFAERARRYYTERVVKLGD